MIQWVGANMMGGPNSGPMMGKMPGSAPMMMGGMMGGKQPGGMPMIQSVGAQKPADEVMMTESLSNVPDLVDE